MKWLNGKKSVIGGALLLVSTIVRWVSDGDVPDAAVIVEAVGAIIAAIGLGHKGVKSVAGGQ